MLLQGRKRKKSRKPLFFPAPRSGLSLAGGIPLTVLLVGIGVPLAAGTVTEAVYLPVPITEVEESVMLFCPMKRAAVLYPPE